MTTMHERLARRIAESQRCLWMIPNRDHPYGEDCIQPGTCMAQARKTATAAIGFFAEYVQELFPEAGHALVAEEGTGDPTCLCGYKPIPPVAWSELEAAALINQHVVDVMESRL